MKIVLKPLKGPTTAHPTGFVVDFDFNSRFMISRTKNWKDSENAFEMGEFEGLPCLYIRDGYLSYPHAEVINVGGKIGIKEASENVKNHIYVNVEVPTQTNFVKEAILQIGDTLTLGVNVLRIEGQSPEQKIISQVYPQLIYVETLNLEGTLHLCRSYQGQEILIEYYKYANLNKVVRQSLMELKDQFEKLKEYREKDPDIEKITSRILNLDLMEAEGNGYLFIVREKIYSPNLEEVLIKRKQGFSVRQAFEFGLLIIEGLIKLQPLTKQIYQNLVLTSVHFDRHAQNPRIIFDKIFDMQFIISKSDPLVGGEFTVDKLYWPPEYVEFGKFSIRSQIYGVTLFMLSALLGEPPIKATSETELRNALRNEKIKIPEDMPKHAKKILERGCAIGQHNRFQNLFEFKLALSQCIKQLPADIVNEDDI